MFSICSLPDDRNYSFFFLVGYLSLSFVANEKSFSHAALTCTLRDFILNFIQSTGCDCCVGQQEKIERNSKRDGNLLRRSQDTKKKPQQVNSSNARVEIRYKKKFDDGNSKKCEEKNVLREIIFIAFHQDVDRLHFFDDLHDNAAVE